MAVVSGKIVAAATISGRVSAASVYVNDYVIALDPIEGGCRLTVTHGDNVQTMDIMDGKPGQDAPQEAVLYTPQTLTAEQQAQARENVGAASAGDVEKVEAALPGKLTEPAEGLAMGKYFRVAALDENGHAVLEAVDAPKEGLAITPTGWPEWTADEQATARERMGLPGNFELVADIELTEETRLVSIEFENYLRELYVVFSGTATNNGNAGIDVYFDDGTKRKYAPTCPSWMSTSNRHAIAHIRLNQGIIYSEASTSTTNNEWATANLCTNLSGFALLTETQKAIQGIDLYSLNNFSWNAGCKFTVYGVKA